MVNIVSYALTKIGFKVEKIDEILEGNKPKREDLRITSTEILNNWEGIIEVRSYSKSAGTTADLLRLNRFSEFYFKEKNRFPDKRIYIVNGQIDLPPNRR